MAQTGPCEYVAEDAQGTLAIGNTGIPVRAILDDLNGGRNSK